MHRFSRFSLIRRSRKVESASRSLPSHNVTWIYFIVPHYMPDLNRKPVSLELGASLVAARGSKFRRRIIPGRVVEKTRGEDRRKRNVGGWRTPFCSSREPAHSRKASAAYRPHLATRLFEISHELDAQRAHCNARDSDIARRVSYRRRRRRHRRRRRSRHSRVRYLFREE